MAPVRTTSDDTVLAGVLRAGEWMVLVLAVGSVLAAVVLPRLAGATPYAVLTGSMRPTMPPGTLVVDRAVAPAQVHVGDVITFMPRPADPSLVTHRVVAQGIDAMGDRVFFTRGDANDVRDPEPVHGYQVVGKRWYFVPYLGYVVEALTSRQRTVATCLVSGGLALYAVLMFGSALLDRVRRPRRPVHG